MRMSKIEKLESRILETKGRVRILYKDYAGHVFDNEKMLTPGEVRACNRYVMFDLQDRGL